MKGLLWKDWLILWKQYRFLLAMALLYIVVGTIKADNFFFIGVAGLFMSMLPVTALGLDERSHWDRYAVMLPCTKQEVVRVKYLFGIIGVLVVSGLYLILRTVYCLATLGSAPIGQILGIALGISCMSILYLAVNLPVMFKKGVEKGRLWFYMTVALMAIAYMMIGRYAERGAEAKQMANAVLHNGGIQGSVEAFSGIQMITAVIITIAITTVSVKIAETFYEKREV